MTFVISLFYINVRPPVFVSEIYISGGKTMRYFDKIREEVRKECLC